MWRRIRSGLEMLQTAWGIVSSAYFQGTIWPIIVAAGALMIGAAQQEPWLHVYIVAVVAFAAAAHGLLRFDEWIERRRVQSKLRFMEAYASAHGTKHEDDGVLVIPSVQFGLRVDNTASFPIFFKINRFKSDFDRRNHEGNGPGTSGVVMTARPSRLGGTKIINDPPIRIDPNNRKSGTVDFEIAYGREGKLKHAIRHKLLIHLGNDPRHRDVATVSWEYDDQPSDCPSD